ncbi:hypothetical protein MKY95_20885 [Paenibacillus sp. FSL P4-0176]|uniref:hypothetical protein n=1 Tax=Paenibacillus sp. FSL P4-0176 TaxID=2921631 RepID=UPI0030D07759
MGDVVFLDDHENFKNSNKVVDENDENKDLIQRYIDLHNMDASKYHSATKEGNNMDESTKALINRLDQDMRDHKQEIRDRDAAITADAKERENRYRDEMKAQDERWRQESKEREERLMSALNDMKNELRSDFQDVKDESRTTRNTVIALTISIILGVAAMVLAVIYGIE